MPTTKGSRTVRKSVTKAPRTSRTSPTSRTSRTSRTSGTSRTPAARRRAAAQSDGDRAKPGSSGEGEYFHIEVRPRSAFASFRTQDVGEKGGIQRVAGKRESGSWDTQKWLISKQDAHVEDGRLVPDTDAARELLEDLGAPPEHIEGDRFRAKPRRNVPEREKPTQAQQAARRRNIKKAQAAKVKA